MEDNLKKYNQVFIDTFGVEVSDLCSLKLKEAPEWDSVGHIGLIATLEDCFNINIDPEDIFELTGYEKGINILQEKYDIKFS